MKLFNKKSKDIIKNNHNWKIEKNCLNLIFEAAKSTFPNEFGGLLRVDDENKNIISELILLPGTISGDSHTIFKLHMMPIDFNVVGTVHSHPSNSYYPSEGDLYLFQKHGKIHIIVAHPYSLDSFRTYNQLGKSVNIEII